MPDPNLWVDEWSDEHMIIPKSSGSNEYGDYKTSRTPHAREIMRCLSDNHPCHTVVAMVASQMFKTQIALNWFCSTVHQSPSNFLWLMPTGALHKRIAVRIDKTIAAVPAITNLVADPRSRDAKNSMDQKEYVGGSVFIATAGRAANLAEVPARRVSIDEVDRCVGDVDDEGDPIKLAEARQTTFEHNRKSYYYSSPTIDGRSRIKELFDSGTQRHPLAECVHCGHAQQLIFENLLEDAAYPCVECGGLHYEQHKTQMFKGGLWTDPVEGSDLRIETFEASAMFLPFGWKSWASLLADHKRAVRLADAGNENELIVFTNTRLARTFKRTTDVTTHQAVMDRAMDYRVRTLPPGVLLLTAGVDTQDNRLAVHIWGWGRGLRGWAIDYVELMGDPAEPEVWEDLTELLNTPIGNLIVKATCIDTGGHRGEAVKNYVRSRNIKTPIAIFGSTKLKAPPLGKGKMQDVNWKGVSDKRGVMLHEVGGIEIKHNLFARLQNDAVKEPDDRMLNFSKDFDDNYFAGIVSETFDRQNLRYVKKSGIRNEPLDTTVYAYAALYHQSIRANLANDAYWDRLEQEIKVPTKVLPSGKISLGTGGRW